VREVVKEELVLMERRMVKRNKKLMQESPVAPQVERSGIDEIRERFQRSQGGQSSSDYADIDSRAPKRSVGTSGSKPSNPRSVVEGEVFASGQGVLEWFKQSKDASALAEHKRALENMQKTDEYVQEIIGKRRL